MVALLLLKALMISIATVVGNTSIKIRCDLRILSIYFGEGGWADEGDIP